MEQKRGLNMREIMITVILAIVCGFMYFGLDTVNKVLGGIYPALGETIYGLWFIAATLVAYIVQKPFVAIIAELAAAAIETMMGGLWGLTTLWYGLAQGIPVELVFLLFGYRRIRMSGILLGGALAAVAATIVDAFYGTFSGMAATTFAISMVVRLISGAVLGGWLGKFIVDLLAKTGVLNSYAIVKKQASNPFEQGATKS